MEGEIVMPRKVGDMDFGPDAQMGYAALRVRWFDYYLRGIDNGLTKEPPVKIFVMGVNKWRDENEWPLKRAIPTKFYLRSVQSGSIASLNDGSLMKDLPAAGDSDVYNYDPRDPTPMIGGDLFVEPMGARDRQASDQKELDLYDDANGGGHGSIRAKHSGLYVSSSANDTDFIATLSDVHPDGYAQTLRESILRASRRESLSNPTPIVPGRVYKLTIQIHPISNVFMKGHRLRLTVSSSSFPKYMPNHNSFAENNEDAPWTTAKNTVYHDARKLLTLIVPLVPAK